MTVPVAAGEAVVGTGPDLDEADAAFDEAAGDEAAFGHFGGDGIVEAVKFTGGGGLAGDAEDIGGAELELGGHFVGRYAGFEAGVAGVSLEVAAVHFVEEGEAFALAGFGDVFGVGGSGQIVDGMRGTDADGGGLVGGGEEASGPVAGPVGGDAAAVWQDDELGEVFVEGTEGVGDPGAGAGEAGEDEPGILHEGGGAVDA